MHGDYWLRSQSFRCGPDLYSSSLFSCTIRSCIIMQCAWPFKQLYTPNDLWLSLTPLCCVRGLSFHFFKCIFCKKCIFAQEVYLHQWTLDLWVWQNLHGTLMSFCTMQQCSWDLKQMELCEGYVCCNMFAMFIRCQSNLLTEMRERKWGRLGFLFLFCF